jgi:hypothetical protein
MSSSETLKFAYRRILPIICITAIVFFIIAYFIAPIALTFEVFIIVYWGLIIPSLVLSYQARRWTLPAVKKYGMQSEENPVMRGMLARGDSKQYWLVWLCFCLFFLFLSILPFVIKINAQFYLTLTFAPLCLFTLTLKDFLNDFREVRKIKKKERRNNLSNGHR